MRLDLRSGDGEGGGGEGAGGGPLEGMIEVLVAGSQAPPKEVRGVSQGFLDGEFVFVERERERLSCTPGILNLFVTLSQSGCSTAKSLAYIR